LNRSPESKGGYGGRELRLLLRAFIILAALAVSCAVWAEGVVPPTMAPTKPLTINEALQIAFKNNPDIRTATAQVNRSIGVIEEARARFNPTFTAQAVQLYQGPVTTIPASPLSGGVPLTITPASNTTAQASFFLPLDISGRLHYSTDIAKYQFQINYLSLLRASEQLIYQVKSSYYNLLRACGQEQTAQAAVDVAAAQLANTQARFTAGTVPKFDVTSAQVNLANLTQILITAESRVNIAQTAFNRLLGIDVTSPTQVAPVDIPIIVGKVDIPAAENLAKSRRPDITIAQTSIALQRKNIKLQRTGILPTLGVTGAYNYTVVAQGFNSSSTSWNTAITFSVPIWDGGVTKARVNEAYADLQAANDAFDTSVLTVTQETSTAALNLEEAAQRTQSTAENVTLAEEALRLANVRYAAGIAVLVEVTNAQSQLTQARFNYVQAQYDYAIALADLQRSISAQPEITRLRLIDYMPVLTAATAPGKAPIPTVPPVPGIPTIPALPTVTGIPTLPTTPVSPALPGQPTTPTTIPGTPAVPTTPQSPPATVVPVSPVNPVIPGAPPVPGAPTPTPTAPPVPPGAPSLPAIPPPPAAPIPPGTP